MMGRTLFLGPWYGEFGHELLWVGMARAESRPYETVVACSRPGSAALYADFADEFIPHGIRCQSVIADATAATRPSRAEVESLITPCDRRFLPCEYHGRGEVEWRRYGTQGKREPGLCVVHARQRSHVPERNWPAREWNRLARWMFRGGLIKRLVCVGLRDHARMVEGARDMRGAPLAEQMDVCAAAEFGIGPSSGPMHLMEHCGTPVVVWCGGGASERKRTQRRYISEWNPFRVFAHVHQHASWQPGLNTVKGWVETFVAELRERGA